MSVFSCNPWATDRVAGACPSSPVAVGREQAALPATEVVRRAMLEAGIGPLDYVAAMDRGVIPGELAGVDCGCGCGGAGACGGLGDYGVPDFSAVAADPLGFLKSNAFPMALGAALVLVLKRR